MPISKANAKRYPGNWPYIRSTILRRAGDKCEWCGALNHDFRMNANDRVIEIVLTIAHLDHTPENCAPENLRALCQRCHLRFDAKHHQRNAYATRRKDKAAGDLFQ